MPLPLVGLSFQRVSIYIDILRNCPLYFQLTSVNSKSGMKEGGGVYARCVPGNI